MQRDRVILVGTGITLACLLLATLAPRIREPRYQGLPVSAWISNYKAAPPWLHTNSAAQKAASDAMQRLGGSAVPYLVGWMRYKSPQQRMQLLAKAHCPKKVLDWLQDRDRRYTERAEAACIALTAMGEPALNAIPGLTDMLRDKNNYEAARRALRVLLQLGKPGLEPTLVGLENENPKVRAQTLYAILWADTHAQTTAPCLLHTLNDPDASVRRLAALALGQIAPEALTNAAPK